MGRSRRTKKKNVGQFKKGVNSRKHTQKGKFKQGQRGTVKTYNLEAREEPTRIRRLPHEMFQKVAKVTSAGLPHAPDADGQPGSAMLLRPKGTTATPLSTQYADTLYGEDNEMRLLHKGRVQDMWNSCFQEHGQQGDCDRPHLVIYKEIKKGLGWKQGLRCENCTYASTLYKLYNEVAHEGVGAKRAACNVGLQIGLQDSPISNSKMRMILAATNTPPPARTSMQRLSNKVGKSTVELNKDDMAARKKEFGAINELRGLPKEAPINVSFDVRYNSNTIISTKKLGQNASQAIGAAIEHHTDGKQIIGFHLENKLCWVGSWLRNNGFLVECPNHEDCTATIADEDPFSERNLGEQIGEDLAEHNVLVHYVATDSDARGAEGVSCGIKKKFPACNIQRQADTTHLGQSQFRHAMKASFSEGMFPAKSAERRKEQHKMLSLDIRTRCHAVLSRMHQIYAGDIDKIAKKMPSVIQATVDCYSGDCGGCRYRAIVCGGGKTTGWWRKSPYLSHCGLNHLMTDDADRKLLASLLRLRLGVEALRLTRQNLSTNKNEAINRAFSASLPKNVNFGRNALARASSTIHRLNLGAGDSLIKKLDHVGAPITRGRYVAKTVKSLQTQSRYHISYMRKSLTRREKLYKRIKKMRRFLTAKYLKRVRPDYRKRQLDPEFFDQDTKPTLKYYLRPRQNRNPRCDHPYFKPLHYI